MPRPGREQQEQQRRETAKRWAAWIATALDRMRWTPAAFAAASDGAISRQVASKWLNADHTATAELAIIAARILKADAIEALRAAGHDEIADLAAQIRTDPIGARITHELEAIEDDEWLRWLDDEHARGIVTDDEHRKMRADYLRRKEESIRLMRADYERALRRDQPGNAGNGSSAAM